MERECGHCGGSGLIEFGCWPCPECNGTGWVDPEPFCLATDDDPECLYPGCCCRDAAAKRNPELDKVLADALAPSQ